MTRRRSADFEYGLGMFGTSRTVGNFPDWIVERPAVNNLQRLDVEFEHCSVPFVRETVGNLKFMRLLMSQHDSKLKGMDNIQIRLSHNQYDDEVSHEQHTECCLSVMNRGSGMSEVRRVRALVDFWRKQCGMFLAQQAFDCDHESGPRHLFWGYNGQLRHCLRFDSSELKDTETSE